MDEDKKHIVKRQTWPELSDKNKHLHGGFIDEKTKDFEMRITIDTDISDTLMKSRSFIDHFKENEIYREDK